MIESSEWRTHSLGSYPTTFGTRNRTATSTSLPGLPSRQCQTAEQICANEGSSRFLEAAGELIDQQDVVHGQRPSASPSEANDKIAPEQHQPTDTAMQPSVVLTGEKTAQPPVRVAGHQALQLQSMPDLSGRGIERHEHPARGRSTRRRTRFRSRHAQGPVPCRARQAPASRWNRPVRRGECRVLPLHRRPLRRVGLHPRAGLRRSRSSRSSAAGSADCS